MEDDEEVAKEILKSTKQLEGDLENLQLETLLSGKYDRNNAILTLHPGAGGTESQDWAEMLYRMYTRWATKKGYEVKAYMNKYKDGKLIDTYLIRHEIYQPTAGIVIEGAKTLPTGIKPILD